MFTKLLRTITSVQLGLRMPQGTPVGKNLPTVGIQVQKGSVCPEMLYETVIRGYGLISRLPT